MKELLDVEVAVGKPVYKMADELPLVLIDCGFEDVKFTYDSSMLASQLIIGWFY